MAIRADGDYCLSWYQGMKGALSQMELVMLP
jgi:hypothetical protein